MDLDLRSLRHVIALARHRHYGRAAVALNLSQPALSRSIAALERDLGVRLFDRTRRGVQPTSYGELILARGEAVLAGAADLKRALGHLQGLQSGELRVGAGLYPARISVAQALGRMAGRHPGLRLSLLSRSWRAVADAIGAGEIDIAVVELSVLAGASGLEAEALRPHRAAFVCRSGHPLSGRRAPRLVDILAYPLVGPKLPPRVGASLARASRHPLVDEVGDYVPTLHVDGVQEAIDILLASDCVGLLPLPVAARDIDAGALTVLDHRAPWLRTNYGFVWSRGRPLSPPAEAFMAEVRAVEDEVRACAEGAAPP
jgi:DNA-binding transcriptional LysR family regulator